MTGNREQLEQLREDYRSCSTISEADRRMLAYAVKLTTSLSAVNQDDVADLREVGLSDEAILEINAAAAYMNFVNRIATGLGIELEAGFASFTR